MKLLSAILVLLLSTIITVFGQSAWQKEKEELIFQNVPFPQCHASTLVEVTLGKLLAAWFGGTHERHPDVGIWLAVQENGKWSKPTLMAEGIINDTLRYPCWNPVLFKAKEGKLFLFYKVGPSPSDWWGLVRTSMNNGQTWSAPERLPDGVLGPIKNKPVQLANGTILSPTSTETNDKWRVHLEKSTDLGKTWQIVPVDPATQLDVIQPSILFYPNNRLQILCRSKHDRVVEAWSKDNGQTWGPLTKTNLLNPNSGTDAVTLKNGLQLLVYNPTIRGSEWSKGRAKLSVAISKDGKQWKDIIILEDKPEGEFSYPAVIQTQDGKVHLTYTYDRKNIKHVILAEKK
ncbi:sialidase family protein [Adhaeribacter radiodurans]|uniref:Exo-alpha-sialidase n=1 Tax=Adhaeribacter radiodurans TaxID=2745197 RepID=A0A7L7L6T3_9BACT|nr:sialidase family protein [Adhaeribacter radiodurans]QMU28235.1 exo-alpha-sialidase [Adhaeribacter radiodurans]